jgi:hypothetical protein
MIDVGELAGRVIIVGGPRCGKSTIARSYAARGVPVFCGDPAHLVKEPEEGVTYLPDGLTWSDGSLYVAQHWFTLPGPWVCEGQVMARALRKWLRTPLPADHIILLRDHHPRAKPTPGQRAMHKAVMTVWREVAPRFRTITLEPARGDHGHRSSTGTED